jgi:hypothetical protein
MPSLLMSESCRRLLDLLIIWAIGGERLMP